MVKHLNIKVSGRVQGVDYRYTAKGQAEKLGVSGFAKNQDDGSVYIEAEGEEKALADFVAWCKIGSPWSKVDNLEINESQIVNFKGFKIIRSFRF